MMDVDALAIRRRAMEVAAQLSPGYSKCHCCGGPWNIVKEHSTNYSRNCGCFPLCEWCWSQLSVEQRIPYYRELFEEWGKDRGADTQWEWIEAAVMAGK